MKKKTILRIGLFTLRIISMIVIVIVVNLRHKQTQIKSIQVNIDYNKNDTLVVNKEIEELIHKSFGDLRGKTIEEIDLRSIEKEIYKNPFASKVEGYIDYRGNMHVKIKQREPLFRVCDNKGNQFYIDKEGNRIPLSKNGTHNVIVANGFIRVDKNAENPVVSITKNEKELIESGTDLEKIYYLANYITKHSFFKNQIDQIYLTSEREFELVPELGSQIILLGNIDRLEEKLENLFYLYKDGFYTTGWNYYKAINLKFENQVVCTKY